MTGDNWPSEWLRGVLGVCVLRILTDGSSYGYAIIQRLAEAGLGTVKGGTLYPLLGRLEEAGFLEVEWRPGEGGPGRKFYALTEQGRASAGRLAGFCPVGAQRGEGLGAGFRPGTAAPRCAGGRHR